MIQPFVRKFMKNYVLGVISTRTTAIENDRELWGFHPKATSRTQASVRVIQRQ